MKRQAEIEDEPQALKKGKKARDRLMLVGMGNLFFELRSKIEGGLLL
jgi:hypothetical protein